jgi:hypothetical protein
LYVGAYDVADKRRPRTGTPNNTNNFLFTCPPLLGGLKNLFNRTTFNKKLYTACPPMAGNYKANNYTKAKCENAVGLRHGL